ncbi:MAG: C10 family peptidase [Gammaproteobacteria bacterium]|nr:C10 family peptidase [Gammaproteobacteria bacterium]
MLNQVFTSGLIKRAIASLSIACFGLTAFADDDTNTIVEPLITTTWSQSGGYNPNFTYNSKTPLFGNKRAPVGCIAVAFGQVLNYYGYPKKGIGANQYCNGGGSVYSCTDVIEANFYLARYNWNAMPNALNYSSSQESIDAVSTLLFHIGAAVNVTYGKEGSAAKLGNPAVIYNFRRHFNMPELESKYRRDYSSNDWYQLIVNELQNGRPVVLVGFNSQVDAGHAYIIDGVNAEGQVHVNWGWGGYLNGYFDLETLKTPHGSFTEDLFALINFTPYTQAEGMSCNGNVGSRCSNGLQCVSNQSGNTILDFVNNDDYGTCLVVDIEEPTEPEEPVEPIEMVEVEYQESGSVSAGQWLHFGPYQTLDDIKIVMSGDNDADLYVRKSAQPTAQSYDCRPYRAHSNEACEFEEAGEYYVSINGYRQSAFSLSIITKEQMTVE